MRKRIITAVGAALALWAVTASPAQAGLLDRVTTEVDRVTASLGGDPGEADFTLGGEPCKLIPVPQQAPPVGTGECPGVRPGAIVLSDLGQCTFNFLFDGADGRRYIGTAGHCILGEGVLGGQDAGEESWAPGDGPEARDANGERIGEFAYAILSDPKDFALIRLDAGVESNPAMCHFGGPNGTNDSNPPPLPPTLLNHYGGGLLIGDLLPARTAVALGMPSPDHVFANGVALPGDSGSGVISSDGGAVGVLVTVGVHAGSIGADGVDAGLVGITRLTPQVERAEEVLGTGLTLETAGLQ